MLFRPLPLIQRTPVPKNKRNLELVYLQDVVPTTLHLAGMKTPEFAEFNNLWPLITEAGSKSPYETIYGAYQTNAQRMIREGDYKLIVYPKADRVRLFDLRKDPQETMDLSGSPLSWLHCPAASIVLKRRVERS